MKIDFLYWEECPSHPDALGRLKKLLKACGIRAEIRMVEVNTDEDARRLSFPGSPTIRINGCDIDPAGAREQRVGLACRIYHDATGKVGPLPSEAMIREALETERKETDGHDA
jgi:hypothetical protein